MSDDQQMPPMIDLKSLKEDDRIKVIGEAVRKSGGRIAFFVDDKPRTIARYIAKLQRSFPDVIVTKMGRFTEGSFFLRAEINTQSKN